MGETAVGIFMNKNYENCFNPGFCSRTSEKFWSSFKYDALKWPEAQKCFEMRFKSVMSN
jgi:hypothetical protein